MNAAHVLLVEAAVLVVVGGLAADADADDGRGALRQPVGEIDAGLRDRFARRNDRELRHAIEHGDLTIVEMLGRIVALNLRGNLLVQLIRVRNRDVRETGHALLQRRAVGADGVTDRRNNSGACNDNAIHVIHVFLATRFSIARTMSPTLWKSFISVSLALNGIWMSNFSSSSITSSMTSSDSTPRSVSLSLICTVLLFACLAMIWTVSAATSLIEPDLSRSAAIARARQPLSAAL